MYTQPRVLSYVNLVPRTYVPTHRCTGSAGRLHTPSCTSVYTNTHDFLLCASVYVHTQTHTSPSPHSTGDLCAMPKAEQPNNSREERGLPPPLAPRSGRLPHAAAEAHPPPLAIPIRGPVPRGWFDHWARPPRLGLYLVPPGTTSSIKYRCQRWKHLASSAEKHMQHASEERNSAAI